MHSPLPGSWGEPGPVGFGYLVFVNRKMEEGEGEVEAGGVSSKRGLVGGNEWGGIEGMLATKSLCPPPLLHS